jgi:betaine-homocysteine S-methyltransferase
MAVSLGRKPIAYKYYPDMNKHFAYGNDKKLKELNKADHLKS